MRRLPRQALRAVAVRRPRLSYSLARGLARLTLPLFRNVTASQIQAVLPHLDRGQAERARHAILAGSFATDALHAALERSTRDPLYPEVIPNPRIAQLTPPVILATFHVGPLPALAPVLTATPGDVLALHRNEWPNRAGLNMLQVGEGEWDRARMLYRAVETLRSAGSVFVVLDEENAATIPAPFFDRSIQLARGGFALARITGAPIVPFAIRWEGRSVGVTFGDPISEPAEEDMARAAAAWLERHLCDFPGQLDLRWIELLAARPADRPVDQQGAQLLQLPGMVRPTGAQRSRDT